MSYPVVIQVDCHGERGAGRRGGAQTIGSRVLERDLGGEGGEQARVRAVDGGVQQRGAHERPQERGLLAPQVRVEGARVQGHGHDAVGPVAGRVLGAVQEVAELRAEVPVLGRQRLGALDGPHEVPGAEGLAGRGRHPDDAHAVRGRRPRRRRDRRRQQPREGEGAYAVDADLDRVALRRLGAGRGERDAGVVEEEVELGLAAEELRHRRLYGGEVGEVET